MNNYFQVLESEWVPVRPLVDLHVPVVNLLEVPVLEYDLNLASSTTAQYKVTTIDQLEL